MPPWERFITQFRRDLKQWIFFMLTLSFFRLVFIAYFHGKIEENTPWTDIAKAFLNGIRFDSMAATYFILLPLLLTVACAFMDIQNRTIRLKRLYGYFFVIFSTIVSIISLAYFKEYNDQFNHFIFNLYYDDTQAILSTIWAGYHVIPNVLAIGILSFLLLRAYELYEKSRFLSGKFLNRPFPAILRLLVGVIAVLLIIVGGRGSYGHRTAKLEDAAVTRDSFLNKSILNPYSAAMYAYTTHKKLTYIMGGLESYLPDGDVRSAAQQLFNDHRSLDDLDQYLQRTAQGHQQRQPKHIVLVVMESYDAWPLMDKYASLGLTPELASLAGKGIHIRNFLPASDGTATSLSSIISGLPDANVITNYQKSSKHPYSSSIAESFKRLGYRTRFFYGGYLSWQKIGDFVKGQGFEEIYGAAHIGTWASHNEWGVEDESLFDFILKTIEPAATRPSFNLVLTTSYHPPYELDVYAKGFPLRNVPGDLAGAFENTVTLKMLGHLWYSDRSIGDFVREAEKKLDYSLFAFTGDHYGRKFINSRPDQFESSAVPFILYGQDVLRGVKPVSHAAGSHIDIAPTLIELAAPKGFTYYALGRNMLGKETNRLGVSRGKVINSEFIFDVYGSTFYPLPGKALPQSLPEAKDLKLLHDRHSGLAWWRIMRGAKLEK